MRFSVITLFPGLVQEIFTQGVVGQAKLKDLIKVECVNPRDFTSDVHKSVDDRPFGGGDGMIMLAEPLISSLQSLGDLGQGKAKVIYLSPQGSRLDEDKVKSLSKEAHLVLICGRYGGIDQRFINEFVDEEISIGDYVLSGGELPAAVLIEAVARKIPGVLGHEQSSAQDSFSDEKQGLLEEPSYTRPREILGQTVPEILLSGNHKKIDQWRAQIRTLITLKKRPDLLNLEKSILSGLKKVWNELSESERKSLGLETFPVGNIND